MSYGDIENKSADDPDPAYLHHCKRFDLRNDKTASDGLNGSIILDENDLNAVGVGQGEHVKVYAEANGRWVMYERKTYSDRPGVGMPKNHREKLGLDTENRTIEVWLDQPENPEPDTDDADDSGGTQVSLTGEDADEQEFVQIADENPFTYHHVRTSGEHITECGIGFEEMEHRRFTDPGDALDQCSDCAVRSSDNMTNKQLVEWLGKQAGFEANDGTPAYLSKKQLIALRDYVLELQGTQSTGSSDSSAGASSGPRAVLSRS